MRRFLGSSLIGAALTVACVRLVAAFAGEWRRLCATGELERRLTRRRVRHLARVAVAAGVPPTPDPVGRRGVHRAVHVGRVQADDVDDMGLLEAAMRAAARTRAEVAANHAAVDTFPPNAETDVDAATRAPAWSICLALLGVGLTFVALVRPLEGAAPWLAAAGVALVLAGWFGARR